MLSLEIFTPLTFCLYSFILFHLAKFGTRILYKIFKYFLILLDIFVSGESTQNDIIKIYLKFQLFKIAEFSWHRYTTTTSFSVDWYLINFHVWKHAAWISVMIRKDCWWTKDGFNFIQDIDKIWISPGMFMLWFILS